MTQAAAQAANAPATLSMYTASIPVFLRFLDNLSAILTKAEKNAAMRKIDPQILVNDRLAPDMFPLTRQIQIATDAAKGAAARLSGQPVPSFEDNETSLEQLQARIAKTADFLKTIKPEQMEGSDTRAVSLKVGGRDLSFEGLQYLTGFALPNFFFHITTAYAILRHNGVDLGKNDFLGA